VKKVCELKHLIQATTPALAQNIPVTAVKKDSAHTLPSNYSSDDMKNSCVEPEDRVDNFR
jgi:hypothetical protein